MPLEVALRAAVQQHPSIQVRRAELRAAGHDLDAAAWARFPSVSLDSNQGTEGDAQATARIQQPLWTGGRISGQIDSASADVDAARASVIEAEQSILLETVSAFSNVQRASGQLAAAAANVAEHQRLFELIKRRAGTEVSPMADTTLASARLQQARTDQIQFRNQLSNALSALEQATGHPVDRIIPVPVSTPDFAGLNEVRAAALSYSPELARLHAQAESSGAQVRVSRSALLPQIVLTHEHNFGEQLPGQSSDLTYVALQFQPGAGLSAAAGMDAAAARRQALLDSIVSAQRALIRQVEADWSEATFLQQQLQPQRELVDATQSVMASYLRQYTVGRKTWLDVLNAQREAAQALFSLANVEASLLAANLRLNILTGRLTAQTLVNP